MAPTELWAKEHQRSIPMWIVTVAVIALLGRAISNHLKETPPEQKASLVKWMPIDQSVRRASAERKVILYDFSAEWCGPCKKMDREVYGDARLVARINTSVIPVSVVDRRQEEGRNPANVQQLEDRYGVRAFPTVVIADAGGKELARIEGYRGRAQFEDVVAPYLH